MSAIKKLASNIVDYAGLFPPAALPMQTVVDNYAKYLAGSEAWMLARLIVPASRLDEFLAAADLPKQQGQQPWRISALVPPAEDANDNFQTALKTIEEFNTTHSDPANGLAVIDAIEVKAPTLQHIARTVALIPKSINAFLEVPHQDDPQESIAAIAAAPDNIFAKIRTGGVTQDLIPPAEQVARFIIRCAESKAGFKATAGLHHPLRGQFRLTYKDDADMGTMYGFLNVFVAAGLAFAGAADQSVIESVLQETNGDAFEFGEMQIAWKDHKMEADAIEAFRKHFAISFGSCSFDEPTSELQQLVALDA